MRKVVLSLLFLVLAGSLRAELLKVSAFGGYTTLGMKDVNDAIEEGVTSLGYTGTHISNGYVVGADLQTGLLIPVPFMTLGPRLAYVGTNKGGLSSGGDALNLEGGLFEAMLGLNLEASLPLTGLGVGLGAYAGYGLGHATASASGPLAGLVPSETFSSGALVYEVEARINYKLFSLVSLYGFGGMRFAKLPDMKDAAGEYFFGGAQADSGKSFDFSGINAGLGLNVGF